MSISSRKRQVLKSNAASLENNCRHLAAEQLECRTLMSTYDAAAMFSTTANPNGPWAYGEFVPGGSGFTPYTTASPLDIGGGAVGWTSGSESPPYVGEAPDGSSGLTVVLPSGVLDMHPGPNGEYSVVQFTAPTAGPLSLTFTYTGIDNGDGTTTDVHVLHNLVSIADGNIDGYGDTFSDTLSNITVAAGDTIDFSVGWGANQTYVFDSTSLSAKITLGGKLVFLKQPANGDAGAALKPPVVVALEDDQGKIITTDNTDVVTLTPTGTMAGAIFSGNTQTLVDGKATFSGLILQKPDTYTLTADDGADDDVNSKQFTITGSHLVFSKEPPAQGDIKAPLLFTVEVKDAKNQLVTTLNGDVTVSLDVVSGGDGADLAGDTTIQLVGGKAVYSPTDDDEVAVPGEYSLNASYDSPDTTTGLQTTGIEHPAVTADQFVAASISNHFALDAFRILIVGPTLASRNSVMEAIPFSIIVVDQTKHRVNYEDGNYAAVTDMGQVGEGAGTAFNFSSAAAVIHDGIATFTTDGNSALRVSAPSDYSMLITEDSALGATPAADVAVTTTVPTQSRTFAVEPFHLRYKDFPRTVDANEDFTFQVGVSDFENRLATTEDGNEVDITEVALIPGSGPGTGFSTYGSAVITDGIATFTDVSVNQRGVYSMTFKEAFQSSTPGSSPVYFDYTRPTQTRLFTVLPT